MSESSISSHSSSEKVELSIHIDSELLDQIKHLTNDPSKVIETAIKQWLRGERREDDQAMSLRRTPPVPPRGEWNDWGEIAGAGAHKSAGCKMAVKCRSPDRSPALISSRFPSESYRLFVANYANSQPRNYSRWGKKCASQSSTWVVRSLKFESLFQDRSLIYPDY